MIVGESHGKPPSRLRPLIASGPFIYRRAARIEKPRSGERGLAFGVSVSESFI